MQKMKKWRKEKLLQDIKDAISQRIFKFISADPILRNAGVTGENIFKDIKELFKDI